MLIAHTAAGGFTELAIVAGVAGLWSLGQFFRRLTRDRLIGDTPHIRLRSAAQGYVKVFGQAQPAGEAALAAPLSSRPCVWWQYEIAELQSRSERGSAHWTVVETGSSITPFALRDADTTCLVGPVGAEITASQHDVWYGDLVWPRSPPPRQKSWLTQEKFRYTERLLLIGDRLAVVGELRSDSTPTDPSENTAAEILRSWKQDQARLLQRFDSNHDGRIDAEEWEAARRAALLQAHGNRVNQVIQRETVIGASSSGEPFVIAPLSETQLLRREKIYAALYLLLGLASVTLGAWAAEKALRLGGLSLH